MLSAWEKYKSPIAGSAEFHNSLLVATRDMTGRKIMKIHAGDKVIRDAQTQDMGNVRLGDAAPVFTRPVRAGDKVVRDVSSKDAGKVRLGDAAPVFTR
jgi:hypothetical protein